MLIVRADIVAFSNIVEQCRSVDVADNGIQNSVKQSIEYRNVLRDLSTNATEIIECVSIASHDEAATDILVKLFGNMETNAFLNA